MRRFLEKTLIEQRHADAEELKRLRGVEVQYEVLHDAIRDLEEGPYRALRKILQDRLNKIDERAP
jgi:hypothetical protein